MNLKYSYQYSKARFCLNSYFNDTLVVYSALSSLEWEKMREELMEERKERNRRGKAKQDMLPDRIACLNSRLSIK